MGFDNCNLVYNNDGVDVDFCTEMNNLNMSNSSFCEEFEKIVHLSTLY